MVRIIAAYLVKLRYFFILKLNKMYYTANNIPETHKHLELRTAKSPHPRFEQYFDCMQEKQSDGTIHYFIHDWCPFGITYKGVLCILRAHKGKYFMFPDWERLNKLTYNGHNKKTELLKDLQEPNQIGAFSDKKINDWLEYCVEKVRILEDYEKVHQEKNAAILAEIEEIKKIGKAGGYDNRTWVDTILFKIDLTHYPETAFLDKKITFNGGVDDVKKILASLEIAAQFKIPLEIAAH